MLDRLALVLGPRMRGRTDVNGNGGGRRRLHGRRSRAHRFGRWNPLGLRLKKFFSDVDRLPNMASRVRLCQPEAGENGAQNRLSLTLPLGSIGQQAS